MTNLENKIKEVLENNKFRHYGIRGIEIDEYQEEYTIGQDIIEESRHWNLEGQRTEETVGGLSTVGVSETFTSELDELIENTIDAYEFAKEEYRLQRYYLVGTDLDSWNGEDERELVMEEPTVLIEF